MARTSTKARTITPKAPLIADEIEQVGQDHDFTIPTTGEARVKEGGRIQIVEGPRALNYQDKADALAFMEETVIVRIQESPDKNDENPIEIGVNGRMVVLWRGVDYILKRKYLERLIRAKPTRVEQKAVTDHEGAKSFAYSRKTSFKYPFQIMRDDNPLGADWARKVAAEA